MFQPFRGWEGIPAEATNWTLEAFLHHWLEYVVKPSRKPKTHQGYEVVVRVHIVPVLGRKKLHKLNGADIRMFMLRVRNTCLCCLHGRDARRNKPICCAAKQVLRAAAVSSTCRTDPCRSP